MNGSHSRGPKAPAGPGSPLPTLVVFSDDWGRHASSCQHLIGELLPRYRVVWVNTVGTRPPRLDLLTLTRGAGKIRSWMTRRRGPRTSASDHNPSVLDPLMWPRFRTPAERRLNARLLRRYLGRALAREAETVGVTTVPLVADLVGHGPIDRWIYYCVDDLAEWPGLDKGALQVMERDLLERVDAVVAVSPHLRTRLATFGREALLLTHGVETEHWRRAAGEPLARMEGHQRPLVVFWGVVDRRLNTDWLRSLSGRLDEGTILLVGPTNNPAADLPAIPGLALEEPVSYDDLPRLARMASALIMPYADLPATRAMQPLKLKEYLSTDLPVVVSDLPAVDPWRSACDVVASADEFAETVVRRVATGLPERQRAARRPIEDESWSAKASVFERLLLDVAARGNRRG